MSDSELAVFVSAFESSGFTGSVNWYRNLDRNWRLLADVDPIIQQPTLMIYGDRDAVRGLRTWRSSCPMWKWSIWTAVIGSSRKSRKKQTKRFSSGWTSGMPPNESPHPMTKAPQRGGGAGRAAVTTRRVAAPQLRRRPTPSPPPRESRAAGRVSRPAVRTPWARSIIATTSTGSGSPGASGGFCGPPANLRNRPRRSGCREPVHRPRWVASCGSGRSPGARSRWARSPGSTERTSPRSHHAGGASPARGASGARLHRPRTNRPCQ